MWFAVAIAILSGTGQFFWWQKMDKGRLKKSLFYPIIITLVIAAAVIVIGKVYEISYIILIIAGVYSIVANTKILFTVVRGNYKLSGGSIAHIGIAMMLLGILFSSGYSEVISLNNSGLIITKSEDVEENFNQENLLLFINDPQNMGEYTLSYKGRYFETYDGGYIKAIHLKDTKNENIKTLKQPLEKDGMSFNIGDTMQVYGVNHYYRIDFLNEDGEKFSLFPRAQINEGMGGLISSPDIRRYASSDLYAHVSSVPDPTQDIEWAEPNEIEVTFGEKFFLNDYVSILEKVERVDSVNGKPLNTEDIAVQATILVYGAGETYQLKPYYVIRDNMAGRIPDENTEIGLKINIENIKPASDTFTLSIRTSQKDYIVMKAINKPMINLLWIGTLVLMLGFIIAIIRRYGEFYKMKFKGME
jgi:cytochrome c-type biogenesis protein CcmF